MANLNDSIDGNFKFSLHNPGAGRCANTDVLSSPFTPFSEFGTDLVIGHVQHEDIWPVF